MNMLNCPRPDALRAHYASTRRSSPDVSLAAFGQLCFGRPVWLASRGYALHAMPTEMAFVDVSWPEQPIAVLETFGDPALRAWGLCLSALDRVEPDNRVIAALQPALLATRLGLLARCLDTAFLHLEDRESFGRKLLHHQLMKACFATTHAAIVQLLDGATQPGIATRTTTCLGMHEAISRHFTSAAKLMGGHGFLVGSCHSLEHLAAVMLAIYSPNIDASGKRKGYL